MKGALGAQENNMENKISYKTLIKNKTLAGFMKEEAKEPKLEETGK